MNQLNLEEIRIVELDLLRYFRDFCHKHDIRYFLSNGTLLGAVKYKGFIPWDDDIDVFVPRADYDRLISIFKDDNRYKLFSYERNSDFRFPFSKLCDMTTRKQESNINNGVELGLDIDIFPLDYFEGDLSTATREMKKISRYMFRLGLTKLSRPDSLNPVKRFIKGVAIKLCKIRGSKHYIEKILKCRNTTNAEKNQYMGCKLWCVYREREIIPREVFSDTVEVEFEGEIFSAPVGYDEYLSRLYGDYRKDPPKEEQVTHHAFKVFKI